MLKRLSEYCDEFLIHAVDVEGKQSGIDSEVVDILAEYSITTNEPNAVTYAGGVSDYSDIEKLYEMGRGTVNVTIGSALDLFGGTLEFGQVIDKFNQFKIK